MNSWNTSKKTTGKNFLLIFVGALISASAVLLANPSTENNKKDTLLKAAEQGVAEAQYNLGICYENGQGVEKNLKQSVTWYRKAAEQGDADAKED